LRRARNAALVGTLSMLALASTATLAGTLVPRAIRADKVSVLAEPSTTAHFGCELRSFNDAFGRIPCYGPEALRKAYGLDLLVNAGYNGAGQTIVIIDAYGSPTLEADLSAFDAVFGVPPPPSIRQIRMPGLAPFDYLDGNQLGWAEETSLDVQWAHAIAPGANIVVVAAASNSDVDLLAAFKYAIDNKLGYIISESFGGSELALQQDPEGRRLLGEWEAAYKRAGERKVSIMVSAGDSGAESYDINGEYQPVPVAEYPASSPNVTSVGGTNLFFGTAINADPNGSYQGEVVWNDGYGAGGGGISAAFKMPDYQDGKLPKALKDKLKNRRGYPDVAYNAGVFGGVIVHLGFLDACCGAASNGFYIFGGTSASAPQWAGVTAIVNQIRQKPLGFLNKKLYRLGKSGALAAVTHDVTVGDNSFDGVTGYPAGAGWDLATGWGTPSYGLVQALSTRSEEDGD
jgi:subtilase family serine protease